MTQPTDSASPIFLQNGLTHDSHVDTGLTKLEHMAIEFTKALLSSCDWTNSILNEDLMKITASKSIQQAKELIKQLNHVES